MKNLIYISSLTMIVIAIFLLIEYSNSGRMSLIAGAMTIAGFTLNIIAYSLKKDYKSDAKK